MADRMDSTPDAETDAERQARLAWEAERIEEARASIRTEGTSAHEDIVAWVDSWDTPNELPQPLDPIKG